MTAIYDKLGIRFQYPENWRLEEDEALAGNNAISVYSPSTAFWSVTIHSRFEDQQRLLDTVLAAMREEYDHLEAEPVEEKLGDYEVTGYDLHFYCLDLTNTCWVRCCTTDRGTFLLLAQAEDREFDHYSPVFQAITHTLMQSPGFGKSWLAGWGEQ